MLRLEVREHQRCRTAGFVVLLSGFLWLLTACGSGDGERESLAAAPEPVVTATATPVVEVGEAVASVTPAPAATATPVVEVGEAVASVTPAPAVRVTVPSTASTPSATPEAVELELDLSHNSFSEHIQPIMERSCASCHGPELAGSDHFVIRTAGDIADNGQLIAHFVGDRSMPPWPSSERSLAFQDNPSLSKDEVARIVAWVEDGALLDVDRSTPVLNSRPESRLVRDERDIVMTPASGPYRGNPQNIDEYRCLVYEPANEELEYIVATHFEPDKTQVVHHAVVTLASSGLRQQAVELEARDPAPGWSCFGGSGLGGVGGTETTRLAGWAPGGQPVRLPDGYAIPLNPGDFVVVQVHYHYDGSAPADASRYVLSLASEEQIDANGGLFNELTNALYLGPAEIPCYAGDTEPLCDRDLALQRSRDLYGDRVAGRPDYFLNQCRAKVSDFVDMDEGTAWSTCDLRVANPGRIHALYGHMHELGLSIRLTLNPDTAAERILLDIPDWNFEWQFGYTPSEDIVIEADDVIRVDCAWNRERAPYEAVGYILWADGTGDEMCYSSVTTMPLDGS